MSTLPYFGRTWSLKVTPLSTVTDANRDGEPWQIASETFSTDTDALRVTFDVYQAVIGEWWYGDITVYNPAPGVVDLVSEGDLVSLSAGYQSPASKNPLVFQGRVFQPIWEREGATDYKLTLHCVVGKWEDERGQVAVSFADRMTDEEMVRQVADAAQIPVLKLDPALSDGQTKKPRGGAFQGAARLFFDQVAYHHDLACWIDWNGLSILSMVPEGESPQLVYAPPFSGENQTGGAPTKYTLVGSPQQTQEGVAFRVLLDSELTLRTLVRLDFTTLNKIRRQPLQLAPRVDKDGLYVTAGIRHVGDTRGQAWYSEVRAVTRGWSQIYGSILH